MLRHWGDALRKADRTQEAINVYEKGIAVSEETGDLQAGKEMQVFLDKLKG
jgi:predicted negative regulator of RcsB-dependent stress response